MASEAPIAIKGYDVNEAAGVVDGLKEILDGAYYGSHMYLDLKADITQSPDPFRLFVATAQGQPSGVAVVERKPHANYDYLGLPEVHIKRFTVAESMRGMGIGKRLIDESKAYAFAELGFKVLFGESNEYGALGLYGKKGAYYRRSAIELYMRRNNPKDALKFFAIDISDGRLRERRYPNGEGINFAFSADDDHKQLLATHGFVSHAEVLATLEMPQPPE